MAAILEYFMETFVPSYQNAEIVVNISSLIEMSYNCSPVVLEYSSKEQFEKELTVAVVVNFCKTYAQTKLFPKEGVVALTSILNKCDAVQQTLMLHLTKMVHNDVAFTSFLFREADRMAIKTALSENELQWKRLAAKVVQHEQIVNIISDSIATFELQNPIDIPTNIEITLVDNITTLLRGFSGLDSLFINSNHFRSKIDAFEGDTELLQLIAKMDVICITLHEFAHIMLRKCAKDFNICTPIMAQTKQLSPIHYEFGAYNEQRIFKKQVDWFQSSALVDVRFMETFVAAIETGRQLPVLPTYFDVTTVARKSTVSSMDISIPVWLC